MNFFGAIVRVGQHKLTLVFSQGFVHSSHLNYYLRSEYFEKYFFLEKQAKDIAKYIFRGDAKVDARLAKLFAGALKPCQFCEIFKVDDDTLEADNVDVNHSDYDQCEDNSHKVLGKLHLNHKWQGL